MSRLAFYDSANMEWSTARIAILVAGAVLCGKAGPILPARTKMLWERQFHDAKPVDLNGDSVHEILAIRSDLVYEAYDQNLRNCSKTAVMEWGALRPGASRVTAGDSQHMCAVFVRNDTILAHDALTGNQYSVAVGVDIETPEGWDGSPRAAQFVDLDADGDLELLVLVEASTDLRPRGIFALDWSTGKVLWDYLCGPLMTGFSVSRTPAGQTRILCSSFAPGNGNVENGTTDSLTYVFMLDEAGRELWKTQIGCYSSIVRAFWLDAGVPEDQLVLAVETGSPQGGRAGDSIFKLSASDGAVLARTRHGDYNTDVTVAHDSAGRPVVVLGGTDGKLRLIGEDLQLLRTIPVEGQGVHRLLAGHYTGRTPEEVLVATTGGGLYLYDLSLSLLSILEPRFSRAELVTIVDALDSAGFVRTESFKEGLPKVTASSSFDELVRLQSSGKDRLLARRVSPSGLVWQLYDFSLVPPAQPAVPLWLVLAGAVFMLASFTLAMVDVRNRQSRDIRSLVSSLTGRAGVIELDQDGRIKRANRRARDIIWGTDATAAGGLPPSEGPFAPMAGLVREVLAESSSGSTREMPLSVGPDLTLLVRATKVKKGILLTMEDISAVEYMRRVKAWLPVAQKLAHGIKSPLSTIRLTAQQLEEEGRPDTGRVIREESDRLSRMTDSFMRLANLGPVELKPSDLNAVVERVLDEQGVEMMPELEVTLGLDPNLPPVPMDEEQVAAALTNLVSNAISAMDGKGRLVATTRISDQDQVVIEVSDNGPGIPEDYRSKVFQPFFTRKQGGTGLGLSIVKKVVEDHLGRVEVESDPGSGSVFRMFLPTRRKVAQ